MCSIKKKASNDTLDFRLHHIGLAAPKITDIAKTFEELGLAVRTNPEVDPVQKVVASFVSVVPGQDIYIELLEPSDKTSPVANFLRRRGSGLHHLCFEVRDIQAVTAELVRKGFRMVCPPVECIGYDRIFKRTPSQSSKIAFFWLPNKILIELLQPG